MYINWTVCYGILSLQTEFLKNFSLKRCSFPLQTVDLNN